MDFGKWALNNTKLINFMIVVLIIGGFLSYLKMPKLEDPAIKVRQAMIVTTYPGASAHQVELEVTDQIEKAIREVASVDNVQSQSMNDLSIITVELLTTTKDVEQQWDMVRRKVTNVQSKLPADASVPIVRDDFGDVYGMFYALKGDGQSDPKLSHRHCRVVSGGAALLSAGAALVSQTQEDARQRFARNVSGAAGMLYGRLFVADDLSGDSTVQLQQRRAGAQSAVSVPRHAHTRQRRPALVSDV